MPFSGTKSDGNGLLSKRSITPREFGTPVEIIAERHGHTILDRVCFQITANGDNDAVEQIQTTMNIADGVDASALQKGRSEIHFEMLQPIVGTTLRLFLLHHKNSRIAWAAAEPRSTPGSSRQKLILLP